MRSAFLLDTLTTYIAIDPEAAEAAPVAVGAMAPSVPIDVPVATTLAASTKVGMRVEKYILALVIDYIRMRPAQML